ncbi:hypothetical protein HMPREF0501_00945 [Limosilactobacillus coleohominis 101-4-CHN]|uniref:Lipoprotein n=1 Tax=Limosilactobacillus coleohominis 101-4-CHN TaxID=575594 RepID=C7XV36_9LACO|nr:hypothetical protein [Limosilactobacillus coleohominis]EEU30567.1 hypothetical protein HMPREF0501_00945 [Limosilactobacillus coleohominis 101-4-CHN]
MKLQKIMMSTMAGAMVLSLAACVSKSTTETKKDTAESSHVTKKHNSKKGSIKVSKKNAQSNNNNSSSDNVVVSKSSSSTNTTINGVKNSATAHSVSQRQTQTMTETDARNLVKEHLSNQRANSLEAGNGEPTQPAVSAIDGFSATQNSTNDWTISGTYGGKTYTYHVTPNAITGA